MLGRSAVGGCFGSHRAASWTVAAAVLAVLVLVTWPFRKPSTETVFLLSHRCGPVEPAQEVTAGRPTLLVFDVAPTAGVKYAALVVDAVGTEILTAEASSRNGQLSALVDGLPDGAYWVRVFGDNREPIAEYGLLTHDWSGWEGEYWRCRQRAAHGERQITGGPGPVNIIFVTAPAPAHKIPLRPSGRWLAQDAAGRHRARPKACGE
jgi:hypothetical protein